MKRLVAAALLGCLSLGAFATDTEAATFQPSLKNSVDFGDVALGARKSILWDISWSLDIGDVLLSLKPALSGTSSSDFGLERTTDGCTREGGTCTFALSFAPTATGAQTALKNVLRLDLESGREKFVLKLAGNGVAPVPEQLGTVAPVPVPATLPLMLAGFGLFGLIRRRAQRA